MDDAMMMCVIERIGDLDRGAQHLIDWQGASKQPVGERLSLDILHHEVWQAVLLADVMERADVRMVEAGNRARLPFEPLAPRWTVGNIAGQYLDGHNAIEP